MARMTQAQRLAHENEALALQFFRGVLVAMPAPRRPQGVRYPLQTVVVIALMAMVCGCDDAEAMQSWGEANEIPAIPELLKVLDIRGTTVTIDAMGCQTEIAYYIGSDEEATATIVAHTIRRHWTVENQLHWVLDLAFREDDARHRAGNTAENMTLLRHFALNIVKSDPHRKLGVANTRKRAGWDRTFLIALLTGA